MSNRTIDTDSEDYHARLTALARHLDSRVYRRANGEHDGQIVIRGAVECVELEPYGGPYGHGITITVDGEEWSVLTDEEADAAWEDSLDSYLEECVYPELSGHLANYFDEEAWKRDARFDGRGHCLSSWDGAEHEEKVDGEWFYLYRVN